MSVSRGHCVRLRATNIRLWQSTNIPDLNSHFPVKMWSWPQSSTDSDNCTPYSNAFIYPLRPWVLLCLNNWQISYIPKILLPAERKLTTHSEMLKRHHITLHLSGRQNKVPSVLPNALHFIRSPLCTATNATWQKVYFGGALTKLVYRSWSATFVQNTSLWSTKLSLSNANPNTLMCAFHMVKRKQFILTISSQNTVN